MYKLTKEDILEELRRCKRDPVYFIKTYVKTISDNPNDLDNIIPLALWPFQEDVIREFMTHRFNIVLKSRQLGLSVITSAYVLHKMLFHREQVIVAIATKQSTAALIAEKCKKMFRWLPDFIKQLVTVTTSNRAVFEFSNGSKIIAESSTGTAAIGFTSNLVILDEAAHIDRLDELWGSVGPTLSAGGSCIAISTPNGIGNWYHENFMAAERGENLFNPITLPWDSRPDRDQEWFEKEKKSMSKRKFAQEYLCNFLSSGNTYFEQEELDKIRAGVRDPIRKEGFDRNIWIWEDPIPGESYLISSDTARGDATDYSVWHVLKLSSMEVVCEYQGKVPQEIFANMLYAWGMKYNGCMLVVENNMLGSAVLDKLVNLNYPNLYYTTKATLEYLDPLAAEQKPNAVLGFPTSGKSRPIIIEKLNEFVRNDMIKINSKRMLYEMTTFIWKDGKPQASNRSTDDLVLALSIGIFVRDTAIVMNQRNLEYNKVLLTSIKTSNSVFDSKISGMKGWIPMITPEQREEMKQNSWLYDSPMIVKG